MTTWPVSAFSVQRVEADGVVETESLLCLALCAFLLGLFPLLLAAAATGFAIGIERWLLLITYAGAAGNEIDYRSTLC